MQCAWPLWGRAACHEPLMHGSETTDHRLFCSQSNGPFPFPFRPRSRRRPRSFCFYTSHKYDLAEAPADMLISVALSSSVPGQGVCGRDAQAPSVEITREHLLHHHVLAYLGAKPWLMMAKITLCGRVSAAIQSRPRSRWLRADLQLGSRFFYLAPESADFVRGIISIVSMSCVPGMRALTTR